LDEVAKMDAETALEIFDTLELDDATGEEDENVEAVLRDFLGAPKVKKYACEIVTGASQTPFMYEI
jgi:hypothetical protein